MFSTDDLLRSSHQCSKNYVAALCSPLTQTCAYALTLCGWTALVSLCGLCSCIGPLNRIYAFCFFFLNPTIEKVVPVSDSSLVLYLGWLTLVIIILIFLFHIFINKISCTQSMIYIFN